jgi:hypothetical protein
MRISITILACLILAASAAAQERTVTITPIDRTIDDTVPAATAGVCIFGNPGAPVWAITDWIYGGESYATVFDALQPPCGCAAGFSIEAIHIYLQFAVDDVPVTFDANVDFREAVYDETEACWLPDAPVCVSPTYTVSIDTPGLYDIALPIDPASCPCAFFDYKYAVSFNFLTAFRSYPDAVTDAAPVGCTSWNDYGLGWLDLIDFSFPGELIMFADVVCCENPVPTESKTWGEMKSLFR